LDVYDISTFSLSEDLTAGDDIDFSTNPSTGNTQISVEDQVDFDSLVLSTNTTKDTSGDIQIRDDSNGELFSLDDGTSSTSSARYEGNGAFTFGKREGSVGENSFVIGTDQFGDRNTASDTASVAYGRNVISSGVDSLAGGFDTEASASQGVALGDGTTASGISATAAFNKDTEASERYSVAFNFDTFASGRSSAVFGERSEAAARASFAAGDDLTNYAHASVAVGRFNEIYLGSPQGAITPNNDDRLFVVGAGNPSGRGRLDAFGRLDHIDGKLLKQLGEPGIGARPGDFGGNNAVLRTFDPGRPANDNGLELHSVQVAPGALLAMVLLRAWFSAVRTRKIGPFGG